MLLHLQGNIDLNIFKYAAKMIFTVIQLQQRYDGDDNKMSKRIRLIIECSMKSVRFDFWNSAIARNNAAAAYIPI